MLSGLGSSYCWYGTLPLYRINIVLWSLKALGTPINIFSSFSLFSFISIFSPSVQSCLILEDCLDFLQFSWQFFSVLVCHCLHFQAERKWLDPAGFVPKRHGVVFWILAWWLNHYIVGFRLFFRYIYHLLTDNKL